VTSCDGVLHVSFDVDFLDPALAPGVGTTVPGGAADGDARLVMELLRGSGLVRSVDVVELNPLLDVEGRTSRLVVELVADLFGRQVVDGLAPARAMAPF
jgi:arginase